MRRSTPIEAPKRILNNIHGVHTIDATLWTLSDLVEITEPDQVKGCPQNSSKTNESNQRWDLGMNWEKAKIALTNGVDPPKGLTIKGTLGDAYTKKVRTWREEGEDIDVGALLGGDYCRLWESRPKGKNPLVRVYAAICGSCGVPADNFAKISKEVSRLVIGLEASGHTCEVFGIVGSSAISNAKDKHGEIGLATIEVKRSGDYLDPRRLSFVIGHPGFFRRIVFRLFEYIYKGDLAYGYGYPTDLGMVVDSWVDSEGVPCVFFPPSNCAENVTESNVMYALEKLGLYEAN